MVVNDNDDGVYSRMHWLNRVVKALPQIEWVKCHYIW